MFAMVAVGSLYFLMSILLRQIITTILPFEVVILVFIVMPLIDILFGMLKFIPVKNERTGQVKRWAIGTHTISPKMSKLERPFHTHTHTKQELGFTCLHHIDSI